MFKKLLPVLMFTITAVLAKPPAPFVGQWILVNGAVVISISEADEISILNTNEKYKIRVLDDERIAWNVGGRDEVATMKNGALLVTNMQPGAPSWLSHLEFRKGTPVEVSEVLAFVGRQNRSILQQFSDVRKSAHEKAMLNDARQLGCACQQVMMMDNVESVEFSIDPATGEVSGKIKDLVAKISKGTKVVNGKLTAGGTFTLVNPDAFDGKPVTFSEEGKPVK